MAATKTIADFENDIDTAIAADTNLNPLAANTSATAEWKLWRTVMATFAWVFQSQVMKSLTELQNFAQSFIVGTKAWYVKTLNDWGVANSIAILKVSVRESLPSNFPPAIYIKVAQDDGTGRTQKLAASDLLSLKNYVNGKKVVGTYIFFISQIADQLSMSYVATGDGTNSTLDADVKTGIKNYLAAQPFDVKLSQSVLISYLLNNVAGLIDFYFTQVQVDYGAGMVDVTTINDIDTDAGYFEIAKVTGVEQFFPTIIN